MADSKIVTGEEYLKLPRQAQTYLVDALLPTGGSMLMFGDAKVGKSCAALQLACSLTSGVEWLGFDVPEPIRVVYVQLDTPRTVWAKRVEDMAIAGHPVEGVHQADRETLDTFPFDILRDDHQLMLAQALAEVNPGCVIIDTLRESHSGDENDSTAMQAVIARLEAAVKPAAMILVAHARKSNPEVGMDLMNDNRGSNYIVGRMDAICRFSKASIRVAGRTIEEHSIKLHREADYTWKLADEGTFPGAVRHVMASFPTASQHQWAKILHERPDVEGSEVAILSRLRRFLKKK